MYAISADLARWSPRLARVRHPCKRRLKLLQRRCRFHRRRRFFRFLRNLGLVVIALDRFLLPCHQIASIHDDADTNLSPRRPSIRCRRMPHPILPAQRPRQASSFAVQVRLGVALAAQLARRRSSGRPVRRPHRHRSFRPGRQNALRHRGKAVLAFFPLTSLLRCATVYEIAPGRLSGRSDPDRHALSYPHHPQVCHDLTAAFWALPVCFRDSQASANRCFRDS